VSEPDDDDDVEQAKLETTGDQEATRCPEERCAAAALAATWMWLCVDEGPQRSSSGATSVVGQSVITHVLQCA